MVENMNFPFQYLIIILLNHLKLNALQKYINQDWKPTLSVSTVLAGVYFLFTDPNPNDPLNHGINKIFFKFIFIDAATVMRDDIQMFVDNVKSSLHGGTIDGETYPKFVK